MIRAIVETSLVDWDGKITTVLFFDQCNFLCPFCQNWELILHPDRFPVIKWEDISRKLTDKKGWVDGVVLTGGEPLFNKDKVFDVARKIKQLGLLVKIDTNGAYPNTLIQLIEEKLIDFVAMDVKAPLDERYYVAAGKKIDLKKIKSSIEIIKSDRIDYEFRTTCVPGIIGKDAIQNIGRIIKDAKRWVLQEFIPENSYADEYRKKNKLPETIIKELLEIANKYVSDTKFRGKI